MAKLRSNEYLITFTAGGLLLEETNAVQVYLNDSEIENLPSEISTGQYLKTNSENARKRIIHEIRKRYSSTGHYVFENFGTATLPEKKILIFYTCMKTYQILFDFMFQSVLEKWLSRDLQLNKQDVQRFLDIQSASHPEIDEWTHSTTVKVETVIIRMLNEVGLLNRDQLQQVDAPEHFWRQFVDFGDPWFLQAMLLNQDQRDRIQNG